MLLVALPTLLAPLLLEIAEEVGVVVGSDHATGRPSRAPRHARFAGSSALLEEPDRHIDDHRQKRDDEQSLTHVSRVGGVAKPRATTLQA